MGAGAGGCFCAVEGGRPLEGGGGAGAGGKMTAFRWWQLVQKKARPAKNTRRPNFLNVLVRVLELSVLTTISGFARFFVKTSKF